MNTIAPQVSSKRKLSFTALLLTMLVILTEGFAYGAGRALQAKSAMYRVPAPVPNAAKSYEDYLRDRDPVLGWPYPSQIGGRDYDPRGARPNPAFAHSMSSCLSVYGDSYARSQNDDLNAWSNVLSTKLGCRTANYGVAGYGSDQALLRFRSKLDDEAPVVILSHLTENIIRNLTRNRDLLNGAEWFAYKPRFVLDDRAALRLVGIPRLSAEEHMRLVGRARDQLKLEHENFYPGGPAGVTDLRFPFTLSVFKNLNSYRMRARLAKRPVYAELYHPSHALRGLKITAEILNAFATEARARGKKPIVMLFVGPEDLEHHIATGDWYHEPLRRLLTEARLDWLDFGPRLQEYLNGRRPAELFDQTGHYTPEGDRVVADFVYAELGKRGLLPAKGSGGSASVDSGGR